MTNSIVSYFGTPLTNVRQAKEVSVCTACFRQACSKHPIAGDKRLPFEVHRMYHAEHGGASGHIGTGLYYEHELIIREDKDVVTT